MSEKRRRQRNNLIYYLKVFDRKTGALLGHLVDINEEGIMVITEKPLPTQVEYDLKLVFPSDIFGEEEIEFSATSRWTRPDLNPTFSDTGFKMNDVPLEHLLIIKKLVGEYGFGS